MPNTPPILDLPSTEPIVLDGDTLSLARSMSDEDARALLIHTYRYTQEIAGFIRSLQSAMNAMGESGGMAGLMARQFMGGM